MKNTIFHGIVTRVDVVKVDELYKALRSCDTDIERIFLLDTAVQVQDFFAKHPFQRAFLGSLSPECEYVFKVLIALGQQHLFADSDPTKIRSLINQLLAFEEEFPGGIMGYHRFVTHLLKRGPKPQDLHFLPPKGFDLRGEKDDLVYQGILGMESVCEFYPLGGTADRLNHKDPLTGKELPAAPLDFLGRPLLEELIRDLRAREILFEKITHRPVETPLVLMTSNEKGNHQAIRSLFEQNHFFGRSRSRVKFMIQPSVPCLDQQGKWCLSLSGTLLLKPGGHGAIWELARREKIFDWLEELKITSILARQINNPLGGSDANLLALLGYGKKHKKSFGFLSCARRIGASEGMIVIKKRDNKMTLTNIEYCDFSRLGIEDIPQASGSAYSLFPSNTNLLYVDVQAIHAAVQRCPHPGPLLNFKDEGCKKVARLETTMQNIADIFEEEIKAEKDLQTFMLFSERSKTISVIKKEVSDQTLFDTPKSAFFDLLALNARLLQDCGFVCHDVSLSESLPETLFLYHPALGPLYTLIQQKLRGGRIGYGAELIIELANVLLSKLNLDGSLQILGETVDLGSCILDDVTIMNRGLKEEGNGELWSGDIKRHESLCIELGQDAHFIARGVTFYGDITIKVPDGKTWIAHNSENGGVVFSQEEQSSSFDYSVDRQGRVCLDIRAEKMATQKI